MQNELMTNEPSTLPSKKHGPMTRRQVLRTIVQTSVAVGGVATAGGALLAACGEATSSNPASNPVTLLLGDAPIKISLVTSKQSLTDPDDIAQQQIIQDWLSKNKNVTLKSTAIDLSDDQKTEAAIANRTCPAIIGVFGNMSLNRAAPALHYAADVTDLYHKYNLDSLLADYAKPYWDATFNLNGKYYGMPGDGMFVGGGLYYRRDQLQARGIPDPQYNWSWDDLFSLIKQFQQNGKPVMGAPNYMIGYVVNSDQLDPLPSGGLMGAAPAPNSPWHWQVKFTPWQIERWKEMVGKYRKAVFDDNLIEQNATAYPWEGPAMGKFAAGIYPFAPGFAFQGTIPGYAPVTPVDMPVKYNKSFDELVGWAIYPLGTNGGRNGGSFASLSGNQMFPSYLKTDALAKAVDFYVYRIYGDGYTQMYAKKYELTKDPKAAYKFVAPSNRFQKNPLVPDNVTVQTAYGPKWVTSYMQAINAVGPFPDWHIYFPPDKQTGPTSTAHDDLLSKLSTSKDDVASLLNTFQQTYNSQASTLASDISSSDFVTSAKNFFKQMDTYLQKNMPGLQAGDWQKYYQEVALPALQ